MHAEDFAVDDGAEDEEVEDLTAGFPDGGVAVLGLAFFVETVDLGYLTGFVVAANEGDSIGVSDIEKISQFSGYALACLYLPSLQAEQQCQRLQTEVAPIDEVAEEYVVLIARDRRVALFLDTQGRFVATLTLPSTLFLLISVIFITNTACIDTISPIFVIRAQLFLELRVGDFRRRFNIVRGDDSCRCR